MRRGTHRLIRTNFNSPVIAIVGSRSISKKDVTKNPQFRARKKKWGIFTKERSNVDEYKY